MPSSASLMLPRALTRLSHLPSPTTRRTTGTLPTQGVLCGRAGRCRAHTTLQLSTAGRTVANSCADLVVSVVLEGSAARRPRNAWIPGPHARACTTRSTFTTDIHEASATVSQRCDKNLLSGARVMSRRASHPPPSLTQTTKRTPKDTTNKEQEIWEYYFDWLWLWPSRA